MTTKFTQHLLFLGVFLISAIGYAQGTVTSVQPTRVTAKTIITISGSDFTPATVSNITYPDISFTATFVNSEVITVEVTRTHSNDSGTTHDATRTLTVSGTGTSIDYVAPRNRTLKNTGGTNPVTKITEIFTDLDLDLDDGLDNGFWRSTSSVLPNNSHNLLAFTYGDTIYSTGVNNQRLIDNGINNFKDTNFKAYSTDGVSGSTHSSTYLATGDMVDGRVNEGTTITSPSISNLALYDALIDGVNGLDLGTGITNLNLKASVRFFSGNGQAGALDINDVYNTPDLLITQIAQANDSDSDVYYYADLEGNVIGRPVRLNISESSNTPLATWKLDLYDYNNNISFQSAVPRSRAMGANETRPLRMVALKLEDFEISVSNIDDVKNINMVAGGSADVAFLAYNKDAFEIKSPLIEQFPLSRFVCKLDGESDIDFITSATVEGTSTSDPLEHITYQWYRYNTLLSGETAREFEVEDVDESKLGTYRVKVSNGYGTVILPVTLSEGGTPTFWNNLTSQWELPPSYDSLTVEAQDRSLIFNTDYIGRNIDLEGCDCLIPAGVDVVIETGQTLKLYSSITVNPAEDAYTDGDGNNIPAKDAGTFTLDDNASLIQIKGDAENSGIINVEREASELTNNAYVYWSSPVKDFYLSNIPGTASYRWEVNHPNGDNSYGNWGAFSGVMTTGRGYIKRVTSATTFTTTFTGEPNNGLITMPIYKTSAGSDLEENKHWNLIGNPYPSALNAIDFLLENTFLEGAVYLWRHNAEASGSVDDPYYGSYPHNYGDQYVTFNGTGATPDVFDGNIGSGQGFFVQMQSSAPNPSQLLFTNSMRYDGSENAYENDEFFRTTETSTITTEVQKELVWLNLVNEANKSSVALLGYVEGATNDNDRLYDAIFNGEGMSIYSVQEESKMAIQGRAFPFEDADTVPLGIDITENGIYRIGIDQIKGNVFVDQEQAIYLEDTYTNVIHDLRDSPYSFTGVVGTTNDRFVLRYTSSSLSVDAFETNDTFVYIKDQHLYLKSSENIKSITLYDLTGKLLNTYNLDNNTRAFDAPFQYPRGVYLTAIQLGDNSAVITKKLIN